MRALELELEKAAAPVRDALAGLRDEVGDEALAPIAAHVELAFGLASFSIGGRRRYPVRSADFGAGVPVWPEGPMFAGFAAARASLRASTAAGARLVELIDALEELQKALVFRADCSEFTDALLNRTVYLQAAAQLDEAEDEVVALARRLAG